MTIKEFIEAAIEGGWNYENILIDVLIYNQYAGNRPSTKIIIALLSRSEWYSAIFLDPEAWKAVGRAKGWDSDKLPYGGSGHPNWLGFMHGMVDALAQRKITLEEYIKTL